MHCDIHQFCFRNKPSCRFSVDIPVTDFADKVIDDPEKLKKRIFELEALIANVHEITKG